jgi:hypothetical protein
MRPGTIGIAFAVGLMLLGQAATQATPLACGDEAKTCLAACGKLLDRVLLASCLGNCRARQSGCMRNGCWDGPGNRYCGLLKK